MSFLHHIQICNRWPAERFMPLFIAGQRFGWVTQAFAAVLEGFGPPFALTQGAVVFGAELPTAVERTKAFDESLDALVEKAGAQAGHNFRRRGELYPVVRRWGDAPVMLMDRGAVASFGIRSFGVHLNGFVRDKSRLSLWVGKRALDKAVAPGKLDHLVAGGQPYDLSLRENLIKEAGEEASLSPEIAGRAKPVGALNYLTYWENQIRDDVLFVYDLELSAGMEPHPRDGEMQYFELWPLAKVMRCVEETDAFKFNVNLVLIDFFIRHGALDPERPDYLDILSGLHSPLD
ncbi:DUF4743 domain-containing protein [Limibacillus sp. MBR-115]|jgi:hypothetical protein|uniref:DUF4743 domain-containing protein n=1 Tax=Limibacillus sp. MBR-115 TaxID=3156465 RepID=UPI00339A3229